MTPSPYQHAIYDWTRTGKGSACVIAVAGSGKTTTLVEVCRQIPPSQSVRLFAFNKAIADTLKAKLPRHVEASTFHSSGYRALCQSLNTRRIETDKRKMRDLLREQLNDTDYRAYGEDLPKLIGLAKGIGMGCLVPDTTDVWQELIDHHDLDFQYLIPPGTSDKTFETQLQAEQLRLIDLARDLLDLSTKAAQAQFEWRIDFDDQLYLPILWDLPLPRYDRVMVDEAQDTNAIQREFLRRSLKPGGRLLAVGDPHQAIYGWRGASHDAMTLIEQAFDATTLPLSVCYRCGSDIVKVAQEIVPQIEAAPNAWKGRVVEKALRDSIFALPPESAVLCRNNAPLITLAYQLIGRGIACRVLGRDIGEGLKRLIHKLRPDSVEDLERKLLDYKRRETKRYQQLKQEGKAAGVEDRVACLQTIIDNQGEEGERTVDGVVEAIENLFGDQTAGKLTLSTIHKAKGQEWPEVALLSPWLLPSTYATQEWELQQEENLRYVAYTRAQQVLWIIDDKPEWLRKKEARATEGSPTREESWT